MIQICFLFVNIVSLHLQHLWYFIYGLKGNNNTDQLKNCQTTMIQLTCHELNRWIYIKYFQTVIKDV